MDFMEIKIREATFEDYHICKEIGLDNYTTYIKKKREWIATYLFKSYFSEQSFKRRSENNVEIYVATYKDEIVGFIELENKKTLSSIYVKKDYHNQGIGTILLDKAEILCLRKDDDYIINLVASDYAVDFYLKRGYHKSGKTKKVLGVNMTPMTKKLK